ncbi:ABC transporter permease subunit [Spongiibacter taiwanensis]|uniref:ABC transporter permease subunit n=1 Tax=Spongiibacter taiwanensis TaxID=1748242 RepID=UPI002035D17C|nr:ABC transporter permease subunit [Spongiibacter taiwanensis]USA43250.1 ABC transporter permease subunit [Spongiibacter taiwanensis]
MNSAEVRNTASAFRRWRQFKDSAAAVTITGGGVAILFAILLIFFYLLYEILPLFRAASIEKLAEYPAPAGGAALYLAMEEQAEVGFRLDRDGAAVFFEVGSGREMKRQQLNVGSGDLSSFTIESEVSRVFALGSDSGEVLIAKHDYRTSYPNNTRVITPRLSFPYGDAPLTLAEGRSLDALAVNDGDDALVVVGVSDGKLVGKRWQKEEDFLTEEVTLVEAALPLPPLTMVAQSLLIDPDQRWLYVFSESGEFRLIDLRAGTVADKGHLFERGNLSDIRFLLGGISILAASSEGDLAQWFVVRDTASASGYRLKEIRQFDRSAEEGVSALVTEHRRKGFLALGSQGQLDIFHSTAHRRLLNEALPLKHPAAMAISPRANRLLVEGDDGNILEYAVHNEHPELSWSALWEKVWYESYSEPAYVWQSSSASNDFEPKYSFAPLAFGTLKAAFYAMLIAAPLAICGAIYTAYFMAPTLRRKIKPVIELMEALPTVILGFLAGLWLAPFIEKNMPAVFSLLLLMPVSILLFAWLWSKLPGKVVKHVPDGWHPVLLVPVIIGLVMLCVALGAPMEKMLFDGDMRRWLTRDLGVSFDQRNALVVGIAMGFAVIPTIFSIAEDAIFSVPKHLSHGSLALGATPWQSLVGVVLPTASPGIFSGLMIGMGRAVGETMIVLMATGNTPIMDANIFEGMRTLAANIAVEIGETEVDSTHFRVLFLAAFVLFMFTFLVNTVAEVVRQRLRMRYGNL